LYFFLNKKYEKEKIENFFEKLTDDFNIFKKKKNKKISLKEEYLGKAVFLKTQKIIRIFKNWNISQEYPKKKFLLKSKKKMIILQKKLIDKINF